MSRDGAGPDLVAVAGSYVPDLDCPWGKESCPSGGPVPQEIRLKYFVFCPLTELVGSCIHSMFYFTSNAVSSRKCDFFFFKTVFDVKYRT